MLKNVILVFCSLISLTLCSQVLVEEQGTLSVSVANNAVCEGFVNGEAFIYSFGGIDSTKIYSGIHLNSYKYDIANGTTTQVPDLPDNMGKIAAGASRIGDIIYIIGGYHVMSDGSEISSRKVHRYDVINDVFLSDASDLLIATDDHVQAVWRDSLIYVVTGWSNTGNITNVQIYDPANNTWRAGMPIPVTGEFRSFGASGTIIGDTIYYFGGASSNGFVAQDELRVGVIDPTNPLLIDWSITTPDTGIKGYRMAATAVGDSLYWIGGSDVTYNYDGIAYNGSGGVDNKDRILFSNKADLNMQTQYVEELPMDLRGIAEVSETVRYIAGGMIDGQEVSNKVFKLTFRQDVSSSEQIDWVKPNIAFYPNPAQDFIIVNNPTKKPVSLEIYDHLGKLVLIKELGIDEAQINLSQMTKGLYNFRILGPSWTINHQVFISD